MKAEVLRVLADWLADATYGVNARLPGVPLDGTDTQPPDVTITNAADDLRAALGQVPSDADALPALVLMLYPSPVEQSVPANQPWPPDSQVEVLIRYAARDSTTDKGVRDESITMRAVLWSLGQLFKTAAGNTARSRNSIQIFPPLSMRMMSFDAPVADSIMTGAILLTLRVRDLNVSGA